MNKEKILELVLYSNDLRDVSRWVKDRANNLAKVILDDTVVHNEHVEDVRYTEAVSGLKAAYAAAELEMKNVKVLLKELEIIDE